MIDSGEFVGEVKVLVGTPRGGISTTWWEHDGPLDDVVQARHDRARESTVAQIGEEILEVVVRRRFRLTGEVQVDEVPSGETTNGR